MDTYMKRRNLKEKEGRASQLQKVFPWFLSYL